MAAAERHLYSTTFMSAFVSNSLDHESLDLVLQAPDLVHKITGFVRGNRGGNNSARDTASTSKSCFAWDVDLQYYS